MQMDLILSLSSNNYAMVAIRHWFCLMSHVLRMIGMGVLIQTMMDYLEALVLVVGRTHSSDRSYVQQWPWEEPQRKEKFLFLPFLPLTPIWEICLGIILEVLFLEISLCPQSRTRRPSRCSDLGPGTSSKQMGHGRVLEKSYTKGMNLGWSLILFNTIFCTFHFTY